MLSLKKAILWSIYHLVIGIACLYDYHVRKDFLLLLFGILNLSNVVPNLLNFKIKLLEWKIDQMDLDD